MATKTVKESKMTKLIVANYDAATGEYTEREMTDVEIADWESRLAEGIAKKAEQANREVAKAALLDRLGITAEEAALLLG
jgi:hypothetical protein